MFMHLVLMRMKSGVARDDPRLLAGLARLMALPDQIDGIERWEHGWNVTDRPIAYDFALCAGYRDRAAFDAYGPHPAHQAVAAELRELVDWVVCDYERQSGTALAPP